MSSGKYLTRLKSGSAHESALYAVAFNNIEAAVSGLLPLAKLSAQRNAGAGRQGNQRCLLFTGINLGLLLRIALPSLFIPEIPLLVYVVCGEEYTQKWMPIAQYDNCKTISERRP